MDWTTRVVSSHHSSRFLSFISTTLWLVALIAAYVLPLGLALAQSNSMRALAERSAIVLRGTVLKINASDEPLQTASANTAVVKVSRMYAGSEIAGDQTGRRVTVVSSHPLRLKVGSEALFFGNPRYVGKSLTIVAEGETAVPKPAVGAADLEVGLEARRDAPVRQRLATASKVFRCKVESVRPLPALRDQKAREERPSEHDPEWHVATVRVTGALRGVENNSSVQLIFPASRDVTWFNSPKLKPGQEAICITHKPASDSLMRSTGVTAFLEKESADIVTHPYDVLPLSDEPRVRRLLAKEVR